MAPTPLPISNLSSDMKQHNVFPECNVDTNLVCSVLGGYVKHKSTCNEVVKALNKADGFAIGIIDADKRMPTFDAGFKINDEAPAADGQTTHLTMYVHDDGKRYLFTVKPAMDKFILDAAEYCKVDMVALGYTTGLNEFKKVTKRVQASTDANLRHLIDQIKDYPELQRFRNTIKYLNEKQYEADVHTAKQFFNGMLKGCDLATYLAR